MSKFFFSFVILFGFSALFGGVEESVEDAHQSSPFLSAKKGQSRQHLPMDRLSLRQAIYHVFFLSLQNVPQKPLIAAGSDEREEEHNESAVDLVEDATDLSLSIVGHLDTLRQALLQAILANVSDDQAELLPDASGNPEVVEFFRREPAMITAQDRHDPMHAGMASDALSLNNFNLPPECTESVRQAASFAFKDIAEQIEAIEKKRKKLVIASLELLRQGCRIDWEASWEAALSPVLKENTEESSVTLESKENLTWHMADMVNLSIDATYQNTGLEGQMSSEDLARIVEDIFLQYLESASNESEEHFRTTVRDFFRSAAKKTGEAITLFIDSVADEIRKHQQKFLTQVDSHVFGVRQVLKTHQTHMNNIMENELQITSEKESSAGHTNMPVATEEGMAINRSVEGRLHTICDDFLRVMSASEAEELDLTNEEVFEGTERDQEGEKFFRNRPADVMRASLLPVPKRADKKNCVFPGGLSESVKKAAILAFHDIKLNIAAIEKRRTQLVEDSLDLLQAACHVSWKGALVSLKHAELTESAQASGVDQSPVSPEGSDSLRRFALCANEQKAPHAVLMDKDALACSIEDRFWHHLGQIVDESEESFGESIKDFFLSAAKKTGDALKTFISGIATEIHQHQQSFTAQVDKHVSGVHKTLEKHQSSIRVIINFLISAAGAAVGKALLSL